MRVGDVEIAALVEVRRGASARSSVTASSTPSRSALVEQRRRRASARVAVDADDRRLAELQVDVAGAGVDGSAGGGRSRSIACTRQSARAALAALVPASGACERGRSAAAAAGRARAPRSDARRRRAAARRRRRTRPASGRPRSTRPGGGRARAWPPRRRRRAGRARCERGRVAVEVAGEDRLGGEARPRRTPRRSRRPRAGRRARRRRRRAATRPAGSGAPGAAHRQPVALALGERSRGRSRGRARGGRGGRAASGPRSPSRRRRGSRGRPSGTPSRSRRA